MTACMHSGLLWSSDLIYLGNMCLNTKTENYISNALKKGDFLERLNIGPISTLCILGTVTARQNHFHIAFRDLNEEYKEESIHHHCMN